MARILDLGCGKGKLPVRAGATAADDVVGVDIDEDALRLARERFPNRSFYLAPAEQLPFPNGSFDRVVSSVALPYMNIPKTLGEVRRVLLPGGSVFFSLHPLRFTVSELKKAWPRFVPTAYRLFVILNGFLLHFTGRSLRFRGRHETFQTRRAIRLSLQRAGFEKIEFSRPEGRLIVRATAFSALPKVVVQTAPKEHAAALASRPAIESAVQIASAYLSRINRFTAQSR